MTVRLAPSARRFLTELSTIAELAVDAARALRNRLESGVDHGHAAGLAARAREADRLVAALMMDAPRALVPPIDGEDATRLASGLREIVDAVRGIGRLADALRPDLPAPSVVRLADLLVQATDSLEGAAATLTDPSDAFNFASDVRRVRREGDRAYIEAMSALLAAAPDPLDAVRQAEMYRALRDSLRTCVRAAAAVERIALKRALT